MQTNDNEKLKKYLELVEETNQFRRKAEVQPIRLGLYGEVGSIMSTMKKFKRENPDTSKHNKQLIEELGDTFWYLSALCLKLGVQLEDMVASIPHGTSHLAQSTSDINVDLYYANLINVAKTAAELISPHGHNLADQEQKIRVFVVAFLQLTDKCNVCLDDVLDTNASKIKSRFGLQNFETLRDFDVDFSEEYEQLPRKFRVVVCERRYGKSNEDRMDRKNRRVYTCLNDVFIGDPLTDNISEADGFRYHDVIHLAHAAILHWSPTLRGLLKRKRKSCPDTDEAQDGGRAIVVEEGLTALVFSKAKELNYFEGHDSISFDLLKTIQEFVRGYEVEDCPLWLWERCILRAYEVFRLVRKNNGGIIVGNRGNRTLRYEKLR